MQAVTGAFAPDGRLAVDGGACSLWWRNTPPHPARRIGTIGQIAADDMQGAARLLAQACTNLADQGCTLALGPMDGSTWHSYRAITEPGPEPRFFLEPDNPPWLQEGFRAAGFDVAASYASALQERIDPGTDRVAGIAARAARRSIRVRAVDPVDFGTELRRLHPLCMSAFRANFLFTPIDEDSFVDLLTPLSQHLCPELSLVAEEEEGAPVSFLLVLPDILDTRRGNRTLIVKTVAALPGRPYAGLAHLLAAQMGATAARMGFGRAIHALMHRSNRSMVWSAKLGRTIRRYALFSRELAP